MLAERPVIPIDANLFKGVDDASRALASCEDLFCRDTQLVQVLRAEIDARKIREAPIVRPLSLPTLREILTRVAVFQKYNARKEGNVHCIPPDPLVAAVLHRGDWPGLPRLVGLVEAPALRPDGSILQEPGHDAATGYLYLPSMAFPAIAESPTQEDAERARETLEDVFADFPFRSPDSRSAALAGLLTLLARPAIAGSTPAFLTDANVRGSGKTLMWIRYQLSRRAERRPK